MFQEQMVELRAFDLDGLGFAGVTALTENELGALCAVAEMKLRAELSGETRSLQRGHETHFTKHLVIVRQQRLADVEAGKDFLFEHEHTPSGAGKERG